MHACHVGVQKGLLYSRLPRIQRDMAAAIGEELECDREPGNSCDRYAVAVKRSGVVIGHLPRKVSRVCSLFLRRGGVISCTVTGGRQYSGHRLYSGHLLPPITFATSLFAAIITREDRLWERGPF